MRIPPDSPSFIGPRETRSPSLFSVSSSWQKLRGFGTSGGLQSSCKLSGKRSRLVCWTHGGDATCESWLSEYDLCDGMTVF
ncbi:hypothetical protein OPV22_031173 [Ensete ventricosum]|uniref:Uncharacterized protein n=1 Tax=Ensete ventricosum TaxID=4639 RepID=A0AAV8PSS1_ENSVE|nr:hypothetical protein OPV22_031173 [Ensete ventricosum]